MREFRSAEEQKITKGASVAVADACLVAIEKGEGAVRGGEGLPCGCGAHALARLVVSGVEGKCLVG